MRQRIQNHLAIKIKNIDLTECSNLTCFIKQGLKEFTFNGEVDDTDSSKMLIYIPKEDAMEMMKGVAKLQIALIDQNNTPRTHNPINIHIGELISKNGYGE